MKTPIVDFVKDYVNQDFLRLHMPGHKGKDNFGFEKFDITEIDGADVLYKAKGIIKESEDNASALFGTAETYYSTEGSSLAIRAMLYLVKVYANHKNQPPIILSGRNAHKTFVTAAAVMDIEVEWLWGENRDTLISCSITPEYLNSVLEKSENKPVAVYITSPDYLGNVSYISGISAVCKKYGILLLVDNAHGAYLKFLPESLHPIDCGADICCDSAHKTLPVITGGAYLHIGKNCPEILKKHGENAMAVFATTSPSYLVLQSLDMANNYMSQNYNGKLSAFIIEVDKLKKQLRSIGYQLFGNEPLKITIAPKSYGYKGFELEKLLQKKGIICEFADPDFLVVMLTLETGIGGIAKLRNALEEIEKKAPIIEFPPKAVKAERKMTLNQAIFSGSEEIDVKDAIGRIISSPTVGCPPAIPIVVCGEEINQKAVDVFSYYGIEKCYVVIGDRL